MFFRWVYSILFYYILFYCIALHYITLYYIKYVLFKFCKENVVLKMLGMISLKLITDLHRVFLYFSSTLPGWIYLEPSRLLLLPYSSGVTDVDKSKRLLPRFKRRPGSE